MSAASPAYEQPRSSMLVRAEPRGAPRLRWFAAVFSAIAGGLMLDAATPSLSWWPLAFPGVALVSAAVWQQRAWRGFGFGALAGAAFWMPHISWLTLYLGPIPWAALCAVMVVWFGLFGLAAAIATRGLRQAPWFRGRLARVALAQASTVAALWMLREQLQSAVPYGGFAWGRLATTQADSPILQSVAWLGFAGLSAVIAFASVLPVACALAERRRVAVVRPLLAGVSASLAILVALSILPAMPLESSGTLRVAAVQGNSKSGIFDDREAGGVIRDHFAATDALLDRLEEDGETVAVIVWPENSAEFSAAENLLRNQRLAKLAERAGAPIVVGTILANDDGTYSNSSLVWDADGPTGARYDKRYPVPFAEYMPNRPFFHAIVPDLVDLVQLEYAPGTRSSVLEIDTADQAVRAGIAICFDIIFDPQAAQMAAEGAEVIFAQTNNADFGRTDESAQQLAIARTRAVEMGRALINDSTVGTSAIVAPDGRDLASLAPFTRDAMVAEVPLVTGLTPALRFGAAIAMAGTAVGVAGLALAFVGLLRARRRDDPIG
ncbi:apolipoprotein N-acyltransferase [Leucobacter sp. USCH14]|uniref:apolipoprotein N-acyltransferase n=1 Tax=Leucobacter sp. USCH14 TaxID=3024838 RepID=UPI00309EE70C